MWKMLRFIHLITLGEPIFDVTDCNGSGYCFIIICLGGWKTCFIICTFYQMVLEWSNKKKISSERNAEYIQNFSWEICGDRYLVWPRHRRENDTEMNLIETGCQDLDLVHLAQDKESQWPLTKTVINFGFQIW